MEIIIFGVLDILTIVITLALFKAASKENQNIELDK